MKITRIETFLINAAKPDNSGWSSRNWLFVRIHTDTGLSGIGEASGWPRVVQTAIDDLSGILVGEDPAHIERLCQKMITAMMGHGMTGVVGSGAITGIEMALWDLKGKALNAPVWSLLGGRMRDRIRLYAHANDVERARELVDRGFTGVKLGGVDRDLVRRVYALRRALGDDVDIMVDVHGPPWLTTRDAIALGRALEDANLLFYEDPVAPENIDALARVAEAVDIPIAAGERHALLHGVRELIEREIIDVVQPDTGRAGGLIQMRKIAAMAEAHHIQVAPHDGSLGPVAEIAALHLLASIPNCLILEHLEDDCPQRYEVMAPQPTIEDGFMIVPDAPGLGIELVDEAIERNPSTGNTSTPTDSHGYAYVAARMPRSRWLQGAADVEEEENPS